MKELEKIIRESLQDQEFNSDSWSKNVIDTKTYHKRKKETVEKIIQAIKDAGWVKLSDCVVDEDIAGNILKQWMKDRTNDKPIEVGLIRAISQAKGIIKENKL